MLAALPVSLEFFLAIPRNDVFIRPMFQEYRMRQLGLIETVRPSWKRLTPLGRAWQDRLRERHV